MFTEITKYIEKHEVIYFPDDCIMISITILFHWRIYQHLVLDSNLDILVHWYLDKRSNHSQTHSWKQNQYFLMKLLRITYLEISTECLNRTLIWSTGSLLFISLKYWYFTRLSNTKITLKQCNSPCQHPIDP